MAPPSAAPTALRPLLETLYDAALTAVAPQPAVHAALDRLPRSAERPWILALGKASRTMADATVRWLAGNGREPAGGLVVAPDDGPTPHPSLDVAVGDHPEPGPGSLAAAARLGEVVSGIPAGAPVWVLLSGGTTSLVGAPEAGLDPADLRELYRLLLGSGLDIAQMNAVRKRASRWGGGKLAQALAGRRVRVLVISDVIGDDLRAIGSGPCVPDPTTTGEIRALLERAAIWAHLPPAIQRHLAREQPAPVADRFAHVETEIIVSNRLAIEAAADRARELGWTVALDASPLAGEAAQAGRRLAEHLLGIPEGIGTPGVVAVCGGETTVTLPPAGAGLGGRCQELALAAAARLDGLAGVALLAAGTDGRDGPTDASGACVDGSTWETCRRAGVDPDAALARHDAYHALAAAGALVRRGLTGTNVMDVILSARLAGSPAPAAR